MRSSEKMPCLSKAMELHCISKPSWCVSENVQLQANLACYITHHIDVKVHIEHRVQYVLQHQGSVL